MLLEEMVRARNDADALAADELLQRRQRSRRIPLAVDVRDRLRTASEKLAVQPSSRRADGNYPLHARLGTAESQADRGAERKPGNQHLARGRLACEQVVERDARIVGRAAPAVVRSAAVADAAEVEAQCHIPSALERFGHVDDDLVVHRSAVERMRMQDQADALRLLGSRMVDRLELAVGGNAAADGGCSGCRFSLSFLRLGGGVGKPMAG